MNIRSPNFINVTFLNRSYITYTKLCLHLSTITSHLTISPISTKLLSLSFHTEQFNYGTRRVTILNNNFPGNFSLEILTIY